MHYIIYNTAIYQVKINYQHAENYGNSIRYKSSLKVIKCLYYLGIKPRKITIENYFGDILTAQQILKYVFEKFKP